MISLPSLPSFLSRASSAQTPSLLSQCSWPVLGKGLTVENRAVEVSRLLTPSEGNPSGLSTSFASRKFLTDVSPAGSENANIFGSGLGSGFQIKTKTVCSVKQPLTTIAQEGFKTLLSEYLMKETVGKAATAVGALGLGLASHAFSDVMSGLGFRAQRPKSSSQSKTEKGPLGKVADGCSRFTSCLSNYSKYGHWADVVFVGGPHDTGSQGGT